MRILHVLRAPVGGLFRHVLDLSAEQSWLGHDVGLVVATSSDALTESRLARAAPNLKLAIHRVAMSRAPGGQDVHAIRAVRQIALECEAEVVHGHGAKGGAYARLANVRGRTRVFYTPHGGTLNYAPRTVAGRIYHAAERLLDPLTDGIIFESAHAAQTYQAVIGSGRAPRRIIHNGLRPQDFDPVTPRDDAADLLFVGEMRHLKGVDVLLKALARVNAVRAEPLTALLVGAGPDLAQFEALAQGLGLTRCVRFSGAMPAADAFTRGRMIVVPSLKESFPYIVLEAIAAGRPLVATRVGGIPEIVADTGTMLVNPGDDVALAAAIEAGIANPEGARAQAARLKAAVAARFTVEQMAAGILDFYAAPSSVAGPAQSVCSDGALVPLHRNAGPRN
ncbi:MAG: glycosyltransferase family 4 protein [Hyphomicrobiaceae bacterium]|nr:glycosyltransferase family 4 protein [Hyphomicrobiaceae bacterium]